MSSGRPASLDGSLLARKGDASPAIPPNSPLTEELGEPRPEPVRLSFGASDAITAPSWWSGDSDARRKILMVLISVLFAAAIIYAASRVLPTTATVTSTTPADLKNSGAVVETKPAVESVSPMVTAEPAPAEAVTAPASISGATTAGPSRSATAAADIRNAKKAPVVALIPQAVKPKPPKPPNPAVAVWSGRYLLQLASLPSAGDARREMTRLQNRLRPVLGPRKIAVVRAVPKGKNPVYRLRASAYRTQNSARAACDRIRKLKIACLVVRR